MHGGLDYGGGVSHAWALSARVIIFSFFFFFWCVHGLEFVGVF